MVWIFLYFVPTFIGSSVCRISKWVSTDAKNFDTFCSFQQVDERCEIVSNVDKFIVNSIHFLLGTTVEWHDWIWYGWDNRQTVLSHIKSSCFGGEDNYNSIFYLNLQNPTADCWNSRQIRTGAAGQSEKFRWISRRVSLFGSLKLLN